MRWERLGPDRAVVGTIRDMRRRVTTATNNRGWREAARCNDVNRPCDAGTIRDVQNGESG